MKKTRRLAALFLCFVLFCSSFAVTSYAAKDEDEDYGVYDVGFDVSNDRIYIYWETGENRRMDMIRFGHFFEARTTKPNVTEPYKYVFPIPQEALEGNPNLKQNPGYE